MYSSRRCSVKRHIQNLHKGYATIVSFIDYLTGRKLGYYWPNPIPSYQKKDDRIDYTRVMTEQLFRESIRKGFSSL
jgi:ABC-type phosphate transport system auxiliary subunit